jgi:hypothetical protein
MVSVPRVVLEVLFTAVLVTLLVGAAWFFLSKLIDWWDRKTPL